MILPLTPVRFKLHAAAIFGRKMAVVCGDQRFTYREFNERCDRLSSALAQLGLRAGDRVAYLSFNCHRLLEAYYGVPQLGAILLPLNIRLSCEELAYILNDASPRVLCFDPELLPLVEALRGQAVPVEHFIVLRGPAPAWAHPRNYDELVAEAEPAEYDYRQIDENSVAELFYTSGTTAHPKGVMLTHRNLYLHALYTALGLGDGDAAVHLYTVPLFHVNSWGAPHILPLVGGRHVMIQKFDARSVLELVSRERVTKLQMVSTMVVAMLNHPDFAKYDLSSVRELVMGGAPTNTALVQEAAQKLPGCNVMGGYGLTETSPVLTMARIKDHLKDDPPEIQLRRKATAGWALGASEIRVVDPSGRDVKADGSEVGEVIVRSDLVMAGYWKQPEETARVIRDDWFWTGDLATIDDEGYVLIVDRVKDMVLSGGENVATAEIERVLCLHPGVLECAVVAVPDDTWGEVPKALVVLRAGYEADASGLLEHCGRHLAKFKVPKSVEFLDELPKGGTGKILKRVLREKYWAGRERRVH
ncbi:MAG TPA: long-chain-fatty-acid--CoA ligase [Terriglobia bacterium]|jgi:fatty-acyl-CoA synthase|nr:long-chain-fatty-acid--CoA ligase [Terriglobia bacterium]